MKYPISSLLTVLHIPASTASIPEQPSNHRVNVPTHTHITNHSSTTDTASRWHNKILFYFLQCSCPSGHSPWQLRYQWGARDSFWSRMLERRLKAKILLSYSYVINMDRAPFKALAELGISPPSIVAIQQPSGDQAISTWNSVYLTDTSQHVVVLTKKN